VINPYAPPRPVNDPKRPAHLSKVARRIFSLASLAVSGYIVFCAFAILLSRMSQTLELAWEQGIWLSLSFVISDFLRVHLFSLARSTIRRIGLACVITVMSLSVAELFLEVFGIMDSYFNKNKEIRAFIQMTVMLATVMGIRIYYRYKITNHPVPIIDRLGNDASKAEK
jgi:hypothetical protein